MALQAGSLRSLGRAVWILSALSLAQAQAADPVKTPSEAKSDATKAPPGEDVFGEFVVTGVAQEHIPKIALLPSEAPDLEDVIVRSVVRRDLEISGLFRLIADADAPPGRYGFSDPVDVKAFQAKGAEAIVKVAARKKSDSEIEILGLAYFPQVGKEPVYETKMVVPKSSARATAHKITDDLLGALTGRPGGFSSRFTFSGAWGRSRRVFSVDADGFGLTARTDPKATSLAPVFGPNGDLFFTQSKNYSPFQLLRLTGTDDKASAHPLPFSRSIYSVAFDSKRTKMAVSVAEPEGSAIYLGNADGSHLKRVSVTEVAVHPAFSPSGKLAWVGGTAEQGGQRIYVEGKAVSPAGYSAFAPAFCDTEDGIFLVYAVMVSNGRQDLVMSGEMGQGISRLTQNQGSNSYPACSPDGRLLAFFSDRNKDQGLYVMSLRRFTTTKVLGTIGETLRWDALPAEALRQGEASSPTATAPLEYPRRACSKDAGAP